MSDPQRRSAELSSSWEKAKILTAALATIIVPVALAMVAQFYSSALKERELGTRYVELAIGILRAKPDPQTNSLRDWAIATINHYAPVPLTAEAQRELRIQSLMVELQSALQEQSDSLAKRYKASQRSIPNVR